MCVIYQSCHSTIMVVVVGYGSAAVLVASGEEGRGHAVYCHPHFSKPPIFILSTISSVSFHPFSGRRRKMTHKG